MSIHHATPVDTPPESLPLLALLADPNPDTRSLYKLYLTPRRYIVEEAADGREALAKALQDPPDVVVTEARLPGIDGYQLCELLRRDRDTHALPMVVLSSGPPAIDQARAVAAGVDVVLSKPCLPEVLHAQMQALRVRSAELRARGEAARMAAAVRLEKAAALIERSGAVKRAQSKRLPRYETTTPATEPPPLMCPSCHLTLLRYDRSFIGGVNESFAEQWDEFTCPASCGRFQYRHRTRKLTALRP